MNKLYVLPDGNGIQLSRVVGVHYVPPRAGFDVIPAVKARVDIEYIGCGNTAYKPDQLGNDIAVSCVKFDTAEGAIEFRDDFIKLINSQSGE